MGKPKLCYFNARGRAEVIRMVYIFLGEDFEDIRFEDEEWPEWKSKSPSGQCPWLETPDGKILTQSLAIARMVAHGSELMGKDATETYLIERAISEALDLLELIVAAFFGMTEEEKQVKEKELRGGRGEHLLAALDRYLTEGKGLLAADRVTLADLFLVSVKESFEYGFPDLSTKHPKIQEHYGRVCTMAPKIGEWVKTRPKNEF